MAPPCDAVMLVGGCVIKAVYAEIVGTHGSCVRR